MGCARCKNEAEHSLKSSRLIGGSGLAWMARSNEEYQRCGLIVTHDPQRLHEVLGAVRSDNNIYFTKTRDDLSHGEIHYMELALHKDASAAWDTVASAQPAFG